MSELLTKRVVLAERPRGMPTLANFRIEEVSLPALEEGEILLELMYLSLDPYMRLRMSDAPSYVPPYEINAPFTGHTIRSVLQSRNPKFSVGDIVLGFDAWQTRIVSDGSGLTIADPETERLSLLLGPMGMPGFTAWHGLMKIGRPRHGETVVVGAASGAVGSVVGQIAKIQGARVIGIAGGPEKARRVQEELGFDVCLDHRDPGFPNDLAMACPDGIDIYFESVGGIVLDAVLPLLNIGARMPLCGIISHYNEDGNPVGGLRASMLEIALKKRVLVQGFIISDHEDEKPEFEANMSQWIKDKRIKALEDFVDGIKNAPQGLIGLLSGHNQGKVIVHCGSE